MTRSNPELDIRWPIGLLFTLMGLAVGAYGAFSLHPASLRSLGINLDLWWGLVMFLFGLWMLWGAYRARRTQQ